MSSSRRASSASKFFTWPTPTFFRSTTTSTGRTIVRHIETAKQAAKTAKLNLDFSPAETAAKRFEAAGAAIHTVQSGANRRSCQANQALRNAESAFLEPKGLPQRPWFKHTIYAPGEFTGYAAVVIPGVNEAIDAPDAARAEAQLAVLTDALNRASATLEDAAK